MERERGVQNLKKKLQLPSSCCGNNFVCSAISVATNLANENQINTKIAATRKWNIAFNANRMRLLISPFEI